MSQKYRCHIFNEALPLLLLVFFGAQAIPAQTDPGPRSGSSTAAQPLPGLTSDEVSYFNEGLDRFGEIDSVSGTEPGADGSGLGPRFNLNSCGGCHTHPSVGGTSPKVNPQIAMANEFGANNSVPAFITQNGPIRVVRFLRNPDGSPDGGVHDLFTITGRSDAKGCKIAQPDFATAVAQNNTAFRIPTPTFGAGLIEAVAESTILANLAANSPAKQKLGISGKENRNGNDGTITRFGWKAQNKSLEIFAGEAYNVEQGVTNVVFPQERDETPGCLFNATPEDHLNMSATSTTASMSDVTGLAIFMRFLAPLQPAPDTTSIANGRQAFSQVGCALCHTPVLTTGNASSAALRSQKAALYSDLVVHNMGDGLADGVSQGRADGNEWRTAPLWGLGQRLFFLHDGRTSDLLNAIGAHASNNSEANAVVAGFNALPTATKQDLLNFLRSL
jgi:CxxC motif-containing protein (DUF1111 family)